jgi:tetrahydromethanopterin S-methyltransferase subunit H
MITASKDTAANDINKPLGSAKSNTGAAWDKVNDVKDNLEDAAHSAGNPVQATVIALAAGFILGRLFRL